MGQRGAWPRHVTYFSNFGTSLISLEWLKVQISNFACGLIVRDTKPKKRKMGQNGAQCRSRDLLFKFWDPPKTAEGTKLKFSMQIDRRVTKPKNEKWSKGGVA